MLDEWVIRDMYAHIFLLGMIKSVGHGLNRLPHNPIVFSGSYHIRGAEVLLAGL
jgi:hypothetical protein